MNCPGEVADVLLQILREAALNIRMAGNADDAEFCAIEANHIHRLPGLIRSFSVERLRDYLKIGRGHYIGELKELGRGYSVYEPLWDQLDRYADTHDQ